jgi:hypothetical protein
MAKKKIRNNFRDRLADYYLTNREITKHYDREHAKENQNGEKKSFTGSEKKMIIVTAVALVLLILKFLIFG